MDQVRLGRRQLLIYFGLGVTGSGSAAVLRGFGSNPVTPAPAVGEDIPILGALEEPAQAASGKKLPEFQGISQWLNSSPLTTASLKGNVVLIQFWTFACINCQRTLPYIVKWHQQYAAQGLRVIGIHTPEFAFERQANNVQRALKQHQISYPVPLDNAYKTWNAYNNEYWPNLYLADRQCMLRYSHAGEGAYNTTEQTIRRLLR